MITLHGEEVKVGDRVWHWVKGWGEVIGLDDESTSYPILVHWKDSDEWYTEDGKFHIVDKTPILYWQPLKFEPPKKPKQVKTEKACQWVCKSLTPENYYYLTVRHYATKEEVYRVLGSMGHRVIEPYLPSVIEREVKE